MLRLFVTHLLSLCNLQEKPGLRLMQYKSMIFERWQRDPRNPRNLAKGGAFLVGS